MDRNIADRHPFALASNKSLNAMTARLASIIGMKPIAQTFERFGIMDHTPREYSMALGIGETTPLRLTAAYAMLLVASNYPDPDRPYSGPRWHDDLSRRSALLPGLHQCGLEFPQGFKMNPARLRNCTDGR
jgi:hypothetical protein